MENVLESSIVSLQYGVLCRHVQRPPFLQGHDKAGMSKVGDGLVCVVHAHNDTAAVLEPEDGVLHGGSAGRGGIGNLDFTRGTNDDVASLVLVTMGVATDADRLGPAGYQPWDGLAKNWLTENGSAQDVPLKIKHHETMQA